MILSDWTFSCSHRWSLSELLLWCFCCGSSHIVSAHEWAAVFLNVHSAWAGNGHCKIMFEG